jgi:hypothetical protein
MRRLCLVWSIVAALAALFVVERVAGAGACLTTTCKCDDDCSGLVCSADGHCCGPPVTGTPCQKDGGGGGAGGGSGGAGSDAGTPPSGGGGGCGVGGAVGSGAGAALATSLLLLGAARRRTPRRR